MHVQDAADPPPAAGSAWVPMGPAPQVNRDGKAVSGRVDRGLAVLQDFFGPGTVALLVGAQTGGVFRSSDLTANVPAGLAWQALTDFNGLQGPPGARLLLDPRTGLGVLANYVTAIAVSRDQQTVYLGTAAGIFCSRTAGNSWDFLDGFPPAPLPRMLQGQHIITRIIIDPRTDRPGAGFPHQTLYAAVAPQNLFRTTAVDGIYKSTNSGRTWTRVNELAPPPTPDRPAPAVVTDLEYISDGVGKGDIVNCLC
jgi:hypothetical protein